LEFNWGRKGFGLGNLGLFSNLRRLLFQNTKVVPIPLNFGWRELKGLEDGI